MLGPPCPRRLDQTRPEVRILRVHLTAGEAGLKEPWLRAKQDKGRVGTSGTWRLSLRATMIPS